MALQFTVAVRDARLEAIRTALGSGGTMTVRTGAGPGAGNADTGTLLCTLTSVVLAVASGGTMTMTATSDTNAAASGTPQHARLLTSGATVIAEFDAAVGSGTLNFNSAISIGGTVSLTSGTFTEGNA